MNIEYPKKIVLKEGEKLDLLRQHTQLIENLYDNQGSKGPFELSADLLFPRNDKAVQQEKWELFFDLFFPEKGVGRLFEVRGNNVYVNQRRGGKKALREMLDYLMVNSPATMFNFAKAQAKQQLNLSQEQLRTAPREKGKYHPRPISSENYYRSIYGPNENYNNKYNGYNFSNNSTNINIGYTGPEEEVVGKMSKTNVRKYLPYKRRSTRRANRKMRKATRKNRK